MAEKQITKIGILGAGTIGGSVIKVLQDNKDIITQRAGTEIQIKNILVLPHEIPALQEKGLPATSNFEDILNDDEISIVVELIGGVKAAKTFMLQAMEHGKSVVTANKDAVAQFGGELFDAAEKNHVEFLFEASVGGAIPIIMPLKNSLTANRITEILGIVNGTTNYMLTKMTEDGADYDTVLKEAQAKGYAEAKIDRSAFICYAGFPTRKLSIMDLLKFMYRQCWKVDYRAIIFASFIAGLIPLITPIITESIFADIIPILDRQGLATVTQVSIVTAFTLAAVSIVRSVAVLRISTKLDMATEAALWNRLLTLPTKFFRKFTSGELSQRMGGLQAIKSLISGEFVSTVFNILFSFWSLILMCYYSLKLTATAMLIWLIYTVAMILIYRRVVTYQSGLIEAKNKTAGIVQQIFTGLAKFRIQGAEEQAYYLWSKAFGEEWKWNLKLRWQGNYNGIISGMQPFILTMILYYVVIYVVNENTQGISYAQFIAFQSAFTGFNATVNTFIPLIGQIYSIKPQIEQLRPILEAEPEVAEERVDADVLSGAIEVNHITFAYGEDKPDVLHDVSFRIGAGENVAIVGKSGCGKSTLIRLLLGFEEPKSGAVYFDGQDLAELSLPSVRSQMGVVLQNGQLMSGDIFSNIVGTTALTMNDAWAAAEAAGIADDIKKMPMGMQTVISEGSSNISGGQRQRILIARALAAKPAILIFDEATSALDNRTQAIVTESLEKMHATRIVVAHRLSTIRNCDRILVMDRGRLVESGTFDELVAQGGLFAGLVKRQVA